SLVGVPLPWYSMFPQLAWIPWTSPSLSELPPPPPPHAASTRGATRAERTARTSAGRRDTARTLLIQTAALAAWRSGAIRTTSQARPTFSSDQITAADGSICLFFMPCTAEVGKAWWLLCQASPKVGIASQARFRDSSVVSKSRL